MSLLDSPWDSAESAQGSLTHGTNCWTYWSQRDFTWNCKCSQKHSQPQQLFKQAEVSRKFAMALPQMYIFFPLLQLKQAPSQKKKQTEQQFGYCINGWSKAWLGLVFWCAHIIPTNVYCLTWVALGKISFKAALSHAFELHCQIPFVFFFFPLHSHIIQITLDCGKCKFHPRRFIDSYAVFMENSHSGLVQMRICTHHDTRARWNIFLV